MYYLPLAWCQGNDAVSFTNGLGTIDCKINILRHHLTILLPIHILTPGIYRWSQLTFQYMAFQKFFLCITLPSHALFLSFYLFSLSLSFLNVILSLTEFKGGNMAASNPKILFWEHSANTCSGLGITAFSSMGFWEEASEFSASEL